MNISRMISIVLWLLAVSFAGVAEAMTVYMNDDSEMEAQSAWMEGDRVHVRVNPDLRLDFPVSEVNVIKSGIKVKQAGKTPQAVKETKTPPPARASDVLDQLIEVAGHRRDFNDIFGRGGSGEIEQIFADTFSPAMAEKTFRSYLERRLDNRDLAEVLAWYRSPAGAKIVKADSVMDFNRREKALTYASMDAEPGFKERMNLIGQIEKITGASEMETRLAQNIMRKMISDIPPDFPDAQEIKARLRAEIPTLEKNRRKNVQNWVYNYRDLSINELRDYLKFLRSPAGSKYTAAAREATEEIFRKVSMNIEKEFRNFVKR